MFRLFGVILLTLVSFYIAAYFWNKGPDFPCTEAGLRDGQAQFEALAQDKPRRGAAELRKLNERTGVQGVGDADLSLDALVARWSSAENGPNPRACRRLQESLRRLR